MKRCQFMTERVPALAGASLAACMLVGVVGCARIGTVSSKGTVPAESAPVQAVKVSPASPPEPHPLAPESLPNKPEPIPEQIEPPR